MACISFLNYFFIIIIIIITNIIIIIIIIIIIVIIALQFAWFTRDPPLKTYNLKINLLLKEEKINNLFKVHIKM